MEEETRYGFEMYRAATQLPTSIFLLMNLLNIEFATVQHVALVSIHINCFLY